VRFEPLFAESVRVRPGRRLSDWSTLLQAGYGAEFLSAGYKSWPEYLEVLMSSNEFNYIN
jgi:hypothetical protein